MTHRPPSSDLATPRTRPIRPLAYLPAVLWAAILLYVGGLTELPGPSTGLPPDKLAHFVAYGILGALAAYGWIRAGRRPAWGWIALVVLLLAGADELRQGTVAGRSAEFTDWLADAAGAAFAFYLVGLRSRHPQREGGS